MARSIYTVSDLTQSLKDMVEGEFADVWVEGEISNFKPAPSGHCYFTLKDAGSQLRSVLFRNSLRLSKLKPCDGLRVVARGRLTVYEQRGEYQIIIDHLEPAGFGALQLAFEHLKDRLSKEGLFDSARKRELPALPQRVGFVTSPAGAVIADMISIIQGRNENVHLLLYPVRVQGPEAAEEIAAGVRYFSGTPAARGEPSLHAVDVIIVARGGGSLEDLWAFNEEVVARAIADSRVPVISAVGHETDFTIADFVADKRAPTPSAAAEMVIESTVQLHRRVETLRLAIERAMTYRTQTLWRRVDDAERRLSRLDVRMKLRRQCERSEALMERLQGLMRQRLDRAASELKVAESQLRLLGPQAVLDRGYALVTTPDGRLIRDAATVEPGEALDVRVSRGTINVIVENG